MKKLLSVKRNRIMIILLGIFIFLISYYGFVTSNQDKIDALELEMVDMKPHLEKLEDFKNKATFYTDSTDQMKLFINDVIVQRFPANILPEDLVMYIKEAESTDDDYRVIINNATYSEVMSLSELDTALVGDAEATETTDATESTDTTESADTTEATDTTQATDATEATDAAQATDTATTTETTDGTTATNSTTPVGYRRELYITVQSTYEGLKNLINQINNKDMADDDERTQMKIESINSSFDPTTGELSSEIVVNCYYMNGTSRTYEKNPGLDMEIDEKGKSNIFNTIK